MTCDDFDLFGNPCRPRKGKRGRPTFEATERIRNKVKLLLAMGWRNERVANAIEISVATLKRYFRPELSARDQMRDRLDAERLMRMAEQALDGNVGAARELQRLIDRNDTMEAERSLARGRADRDDQDKPGKKKLEKLMAFDAEADLQAELDMEAGAGNDWKQ